MNDAIISRDTIRARAHAAFARGVPRDGHNMNALAPAVADWQTEWDCCASELVQDQRRQVGAQLGAAASS